MPRGFASILDECFTALQRGETLEACLARYPRHAEELRAHLHLAQRLTRTPLHEPRPAAQAVGWQQFRAQAQDRRLGHKTRVSINIGWLRPLSIAAAVVVTVLGAGGGTIYASQDALPDSPLYRVKLASEDARIWFTFDDTRKAELLLDQSNERTDEVMSMLGAGKSVPGNVLTAMRDRNARAVRILEDHPKELDLVTRAREQSAQQEDLLLVIWGDVEQSAQDDYAKAVATLHNAQLRTAGIPGSVNPDDVAAGVVSISGAAEPSTEGVWLLGGVEVRLDSRTLGGEALQPGQAVSVIAARGANGRLFALSIATPAADQPDQKYVVSGTVDDVGDNEVVIAGQRIAITERTLLRLKLQRGKKVEINVEDVGGQAVAASVQAGPGDSGGSARAVLAYEGVIESAVSPEGLPDELIVGGQQFTVTPDTELDLRGGSLTQGAQARVEAVPEEGDIVATRVAVIGQEPGEAAVHVEGVLEGSGNGSWTVSGVRVAAPESAAPEVGSLVTLDGHRVDKQLVAEKLSTVYDPGRAGFALIRGPLIRIGQDGTWQVGLLPLKVPPDAVVRGNPTEGGRVFIWASRDDNGTLRAVFVNVLRAH
jgi:hypothetical protein